MAALGSFSETLAVPFGATAAAPMVQCPGQTLFSLGFCLMQGLRRVGGT